MKSSEIYKRYSLKANANDTHEGIYLPEGDFVLMFNNEAQRWLGDKLKKDGDSVKLSRLDVLFIPDQELTKVSTFRDSIDFQLPVNFYRHASSFSIADKDDCKGVKIVNFEKKPLAFITNLADDFSKPSFDFQETPFVIQNNVMRVYFDDFEVKQVFLSFYKTPTPIDIAGYERLDGSASTDIDSELHDDNIDEILDRIVLQVNKQEKDIEKVQLSKDRIITEP